MAPPALRFSHMGVFVRDAARMRAFYERAMGFVVSDEGRLADARLVFLTRDPDEHHQLVLVEGRPPEEHFNVVNQISFRASSLAELRALYRAMEREPGVTHLTGRTHGNAWSIYFRDPEGNRIEAFVDSPWHVAQPISEPFDILQDDEAVLAATEARVKREPSWRPRAEWRAELARRIAARSQ
jgi:catechol 2,3-dioxygenase-like lactoylglutathione lyase family enzyme